MQESMTRGDWWDDDAPYGPNGYQHRTGEPVDMTGVRVAREITFAMMDGDPNCVARGVAQLTDGRVYRFTVLRPEWARERDGRDRRRFASLVRRGFHEEAHSLVDWEESGKRIASPDAAEYRLKIDKL